MTKTITKTKTKTNTFREHIQRGILETCELWNTDYNTDNWEPGLMTIFVTWQLIATLDSIRNSCDVCCFSLFQIDKGFIIVVFSFCFCCFCCQCRSQHGRRIFIKMTKVPNRDGFHKNTEVPIIVFRWKKNIKELKKQHVSWKQLIENGFITNPVSGCWHS